MTREQKLALIVGFSLILLVGVLISDHLSRARAVQVAGVEAEEQGIAALSRPSLPEAVHPPAPEPAPAPDTALADAAGPTMPLATREGPGAEPSGPSTVIPMGPATAGPAGAPAIQPAGAVTDATRQLIEQLRDGAKSAIKDSGIADVPLRAATNVQRLQESAPEPGPAPPPANPAPAPKPVTTWYTVKPGETLFQIAKQQYGTGQAWKQIAEINKGRVAPDGSVRAGARIELLDKLPGGAALPGKATPPASAPKPADYPFPSDQRITRSDPKPGAPATLRVARGVKESGPPTYTVKKGDSLGTISQRVLGTARRKDEIVTLNDSVVDDEDSIQVGMVLKMPAR